MTKNVVLCSDGTGNTAIKGRGTNVFKLYEAVDLHGSTRLPQVAFYDDGVGTESLKWWRLVTGALGIGLKRNVLELYVQLAKVYESGDNIYLFGFSRGAFTVRMLAGLIADCGIPMPQPETELRRAADLAFRLYKRTYYRDMWYRALWRKFFPKRRDGVAKEFAKQARHEGVPVHFIGVWDTVEAYGLPFAGFTYFWDKVVWPFRFPQYKPRKLVNHFRHALSIDDERLTYHPVVWDERISLAAGGARPDIQQVWFAGVHANVGGGYPKHGMSLVPLYWMMMEAEGAGLDFIPSDLEFYRDHQNVDDKLYDSRAGIAVYYRYRPRDIGRYKNRDLGKHALRYWDEGAPPKVHISVIDRIVRSTDCYVPGNIPKAVEVVVTRGDPRDPARVTRAIREALKGEDISLLARAKPWVLMGRYSHLAFVACSLVVVCLTLWDEISRDGLWSVIGRLASGDIFPRLGEAFGFNPLVLELVAVMLIFYAFGWWSGKRMGRVFSEFWFEFLKKWKGGHRGPKGAPPREELQTRQG